MMRKGSHDNKRHGIIIGPPRVLGSKDVLKTTSMHQPKVGAGTSILLVAYVGSYLPFSIPNLQRCNTCKGTTIIKGTTIVLFKGTT
jgi:hypothetical protein